MTRHDPEVRSVETGRRGPLQDRDVVAALADPYSRRILSVCVAEPRAVKEISHDADLPLATTYRHVKRLLDGGLLVVERSALTPDGKRYELYRSRIRNARIELDAKGERVTWEGNEPVEARLANMWDALRSQVHGK